MLLLQTAFTLFLNLFMWGVLALSGVLLVVGLVLEVWLGRNGAQLASLFPQMR